MPKTTNFDDQVYVEVGRGYRQRRTVSKSFSVAAARTNNTAPNRVMAGLIQGETEVMGLFVAPCNCRVLRISANGTPFVDNGAAEVSTVQATKAVIGAADVNLLASTIGIGAATAPTTDTVINGTLSATVTDLDLLEGQHVYLTVVIGATVQTAVAYITVMMEWRATER